MFSYYIIYKPFNVLSQFTGEGSKQGLGSLVSLPEDCYPVGRLDSDSEGLLLITNDKSINHKLLDPKYKHNRTYLVQVDGQITEEAVRKLAQGVPIKVNGEEYKTLPAKAVMIEEPALPPRNPPVRFRKNIPTSWIQLTLQEGKNRQVRHMTAAVGFPTLRLVRTHIENLSIGHLQPGEVLEILRPDLLSKLKLK